MAAPRHLLVIASQCAAMNRLADLDAAAHGLDDVLRDPDLGGCGPGLPEGPSLVVLDEGHDNNWVYALVRRAIAHAAAQQATLVLALLGHGFIAGDDPTLYFMAPNSTEETRDSGVNVAELLLEACDRQGVAGVVAVVDTCNAAGAAANLERLATGVRRGRTSLALLMASAVGQPSRRLRLSRELAAALSAGRPEGGPVLFIDDVADPIRASGQTVVKRTHTGEQGGDRHLWLAANPAASTDQDPDVGAGVVGPDGAARLSALLRTADPDAEIPARWDERELRALRQRAAGNWPPDVVRVRQLADNLIVAMRTARFLRGWLGASLTTDGLRSAVAQLRPGPGGSLMRIPAAAFERVESVVEQLALNRPAGAASYRKLVCRFVIALAQQAGRDLDAPELRGWADRIDAAQTYNDTCRTARARAARRRLRLVVSLHASVAGDWPPSLSGWLLDGAETLRHEVFQNRAEPDRAGTEAALAEAVAWAEEQAFDLGADAEVHRVEVAAPSALLLRWRPEEYHSPVSRLGVDYDVVLRWSTRLNPPAPLRRKVHGVRDRWERIGAAGPSAPVDWLDRHEAGDPRLPDRLRDEHYARAVGLDHVPGQAAGHGPPLSAADLLDLLLTFSPVVLWPEAQDGFPDWCQVQFNGYWHTLPTGLIDARRKQWSKDAAKARDAPGPGPAPEQDSPQDAAELMLRLRGVWDDEEWLDFCASRRRTGSARGRGRQ